MNRPIDIVAELGKLNVFFNSGSQAAIVKSYRGAVKRGMTSMVKFASMKVRTIYPLKAGDLKRDWFKINTFLGGKNIEAFRASLWVKEKRANLILFVKGKKTPKSQVGVSPKRRSPLKIMYRTGKVTTTQKLFIAKKSGGGYGVFMRKRGTTSEGVGKQRTNKNLRSAAGPFVHPLFEELAFRQPIIDDTALAMQKVFASLLKFTLKI